MFTHIRYITSLIIVFSLLSCTEESSIWTDPNPTGGPAPLISSIVPDSGFAGSEVIISGENFSSDIDHNMVLFGSVVAVVKEASATELRVQLPMVNDQTVIPKLAVIGSEFWGYWEGETQDTSGNTVDDTLAFTFYKALNALTDTLYWPAGITTGPDSTIYFIVNQSEADWSRGMYSLSQDGNVALVRTSSVLGNLIYETNTDTIWGSNLRRGREMGWISAIPFDGSTSFKKKIKNTVAPSGIDFQQTTGNMFYSSLGYYEMDITPVEDSFDTTITDISGGIYWEPIPGRIFVGTAISDTTLGIKVADYSRPTSCKIMGDYLYVTQAGHTEGAAISRNQIIGETLGETEVVLDEFENVYALEFDIDGNLYFVPDGSSTLYRYTMDTGDLVEFFPNDIVPTANYMAWDGINLLLVYSNISDDFEVTSATDPGMIQQVYIGTTGYRQ
ncbi:MAG: IPT/TIG domain-containing protein [Candidatus Marinimicrobia bacterium]|nr:IPT/TIG domain-containing protein [Candidatus Neomarinimicrobiota bacterium]